MTNTPETIYLKDYTVPDYLIEHVDLEFNLEEDETIVKSRLTMHANPASQSRNKNVELMGDSLELVSVTLNDKALNADHYHATPDSLVIPNVPENFTLEITTRIKPHENTALSGLYKSSGNYCTQCEAQGFRRITYFLDRPDVMATYTTTITADEAKYPALLSNGNPVASGKSANGKHWVKWEDPFKKPSYLFALVAGDLDYVEDFFVTCSGKRVALHIYVEKGNADKCAHAMQGVKKAMRWDEERYGREYDLDIYMIVAVSDFNMGAMENKGLNIFNTKYILAKPETATDLDCIHVEAVIAHEYFHNWTGNRITCRDWFQLSLKEGLTVFRDQHFTADTTSATVARIHDVDALRNAQFPEDAGPLAHPVCPASYIEINNFYTSTIYNKGAEVIRMIKTILGDELFRRGMDLYFERHDGQAVTINEFAAAHADASGIDLTQFKLWYTQAGTPILDFRDAYDAQSKTYKLTIRQHCAPTPGQPTKLPFHIPVKMGLLDSTGKEIVGDVLQLREEEKEFVFNNIPEKPIPSLLRNFSAPVKVKYQYSDQDLITLFKFDTDLFNRWEAGQKYAIQLILRLIHDSQQNKKLVVPAEFISAYEYILTSMKQQDKYLLSEMLALPSEKYLAEQMDEVDVDAIHAVREFVLKEMAMKLKKHFLAIYQENHQPDAVYQFTMDEFSRRFLKNACLSYLMYSGDEAIYDELCMQQFRKSLSSNMTDTIAALKAISNVDSLQRKIALDAFYQTWNKDALVVDKWFALQGMSKLPDTLENVKKLLQHPAFDIKNPNKVYALIGSFGNNPVRFHEKTGAGYEFLADIVLQLDALNPQVAARMVKPLTNWKRYDKARQKLMRAQLEKISQHKKLSRDIFEIVTKSL